MPNAGRHRILSVAVVYALLNACSGGGGSDASPAGPRSTVTAVAVTPATAYLLAGATQPFLATVAGTGSFDPSVTWSSTGGFFSSTGGAATSFMAPATSGSYTITVRSVQDPTKMASAMVNPVSPFAFRIKRQDAYNASNVLQTYWLYTYSGGNALSKTETYSNTNTLLQVARTTIDLAGHRSRTDNYDASGVLTSYTTVDYYDYYLPSRNTNFSTAGVMTSRTEMTFDPLTRTKLTADGYGATGVLTSHYVFAYDAGKNRTTNTIYNSLNVVTGKTIYEYAGGALAKCTFYDANNVITGSRVFTFETIPTTEDLFAFGNW